MSAQTRNTRSHHCGELNKSHLDQTVQLCGWVSKRRDHGGVIFVDLRDRYGLTQIVLDPRNLKQAESLRGETVVWVQGRVRARPEGMTNAKLSTGSVEIDVHDLEILSVAKTPPFLVEDGVEVSENLRLQYRYLDLRRPSVQKNFFIRHQLNKSVRQYLDHHGFTEVETPVLFKSTPEGARDFIVPSRMDPGSFYALPQSPQILKQLLMVSGMDRYYQIARCFRDEDLRADRQPEFTQLDLEVSFLNEDEFFPLMEGLVASVWKELLGIDIPRPFPRMRYKEAMERFGSDKPDVRFGLELQDLSEIFSKSSFQVFQQALKKNTLGMTGSIRGIKVSGKATDFSRKDIEDLQKELSAFGAKGLLWMKWVDGALQSPAAKFLSPDEISALQKHLSLNNGDLVLCVADSSSKIVFDSLGALRLMVGRRLGMVPSPQTRNDAFLWVHRFPLFEFDDREGRYVAAHHPFTRPQPEHEVFLLENRNHGEIEACAYDLVLNGMEIAGGSLRIFKSDIQSAMFRAIGLTEEQAHQKFGFFIEALQYGTPPHGGMAYGLDRLAAILCGTSAIRDVIAFPKTASGACLMSDCPSQVEPRQLEDLHIQVRPRLKS